MTHFIDLTPYSYGAAKSPEERALNVGWLVAGVDFETTTSPDPQFIDCLWRFCKVSIDQTRGFHECEMCCSDAANSASRNGEELLLGSAEIRVVSNDGKLYAAPNLIYHYVVAHNYSPPAEFVHAVLVGPCPPDNTYFELLSTLGLVWSHTHIPERNRKRFRFMKTSKGVIKVEE